MTQPDTATPARRSTAAQGQQLSPEVLEILVPSLQAGLGAGTVGLFVGAASGIARSAAPVLFSVVTGAQWFVLGSSYSASRTALIKAWGGNDNVSQPDKVKVSALAGASAGFVGGLIRGPRNILPAIAVFSIFGATGQVAANAMSSRAAESTGEKTDWLASRWSPLRAMSDDEYAQFIQDKILKLDVELSMIDDKIAALEAAKSQTGSGTAGDGPKA
ncbi:hypothetical protein CMQ_2354 [Grosmannia clavigera kw1407]|uniref:Beta-ketoacyl synthase n=1 Tax=Grosmannia clavigera (strain kw1407 / UAMH 11150) TaxID=655863 RepID=F0XIY9_GROCL|nr:uncharacterized protein CMQ_2354 [Grosmannia clavigera kw1407]EFX02305.1 hypothetical protein CMQ_2354 [Grosmannia clavigera kw1407]